MSSDDKESRDVRDSDAAPEVEGSEHEASEEADSRVHHDNGSRDESATAGGDGSSPDESLEKTPEIPVPSPSADDEKALEPKPAPHTEPSKPPAATYYDDHAYEDDDPYAASHKTPAVAETKSDAAKTPPPPPPPSGGDSGGDDDEDGMARMSFLEHLEELRTRILHSLYGLTVVYLACLVFAQNLFKIIAGPFIAAVSQLPYDPPLQLVAITPTEQFYLLYVKVPLLAGIFLGSPWLMYQAWAFIAPGLYKRERRWAMPFIFSTAGLFIVGGVFGYFVALRYALVFLVGIGMDLNIRPMISVDAYFNMFVALMLGLGVVFQMPVVIFFLTLIRLVTPQFLLNNVRYAILIIFVLAAAITPTPDVFNMILFAGPMVMLFYVGIFSSYLLVLSREGRRMPARVVITILLVLLLAAAGGVYYLHAVKGYDLIRHYPFLVAPP